MGLLVKCGGVVIGLGCVGHGADGLAVNAEFGDVAKEVYIIREIGLFPFHFLHNSQGGQHIIHCPVGVLHLSGQAVGIDGIGQLVGIGTAVPVDGEQIQFVLAPEDSGIPVAEQELEKET